MRVSVRSLVISQFCHVIPCHVSPGGHVSDVCSGWTLELSGIGLVF